MSTTNPNDDIRIRQNRQDAQAAFAQGDQAASRSPEDIENDIRQTRAQMDGTLSQLQRKLTGAPNEVVEEFTQNLTSAVVRNPVPTILLGTGLAWMMGSFLFRHRVPVALVGSAVAWRKMYGPENGQYYRPEYSDTQFQSDQGREGRAGRVSGRASETGRRVIGSIKGSASSSRERLSSTGQRLSERGAQMRSQFVDMAGSARARASQLTESARYRSQRLRSSTQSMATEQPLMMAAIGLAAGAAIGMLLPHTRREDELMGEARDRLVERGREEMQEQMERGKQAAQAVAEAATDAAKDEAQRQREGGANASQQDKPAGGPTPGL